MTEDKKLEDLTEDEFKELKIEFAPGCFDTFEGTQEELDEFVAEISRLFKSGEAQKIARPIDLDSDDDLEMLEVIAKQLGFSDKRNLQ